MSVKAHGGAMMHSHVAIATFFYTVHYFIEDFDYVIQHVFNEANFLAETQPFIRHKRRMR